MISFYPSIMVTLCIGVFCHIFCGIDVVLWLEFVVTFYLVIMVCGCTCFEVAFCLSKLGAFCPGNLMQLDMYLGTFCLHFRLRYFLFYGSVSLVFVITFCSDIMIVLSWYCSHTLSGIVASFLLTIVPVLW